MTAVAASEEEEGRRYSPEVCHIFGGVNVQLLLPRERAEQQRETISRVSTSAVPFPLLIEAN